MSTNTEKTLDVDKRLQKSLRQAIDGYVELGLIISYREPFLVLEAPGGYFYSPILTKQGEFELQRV